MHKKWGCTGYPAKYRTLVNHGLLNPDGLIFVFATRHRYTGTGTVLVYRTYILVFGKELVFFLT
jgi:hypothetical protein